MCPGERRKKSSNIFRVYFHMWDSVLRPIKADFALMYLLLGVLEKNE